MGKPKNLYHGSPNKLIGDKLMPSKGEDYKDRPENNQIGVYATEVKEIAIAMAIVSSKGVIGAGLDYYEDEKPPGIIYIGKPKQKYVYLYTLPVVGFKQTPSIKQQWVSKKPVKPTKIEKLKVGDYKHLIRYPKKEEVKKWKEKQLREKKNLGRHAEIKIKKERLFK